MINLYNLKNSLFQKKKTNAIDFKNNSTIFSTFITNKIELRSKNNFATFIKNAQRCGGMGCVSERTDGG